MLSYRLLHGDVREQLRSLPVGGAQCCVTSPPYWRLRDYGHAEQIGLEPTPEAYVQTLVDVFREVRRVLADDGTAWINLGDSYVGGGRGGGAWAFCKDKKGWRSAPDGLKHKDLVGIPWRVAFALQADGWYLRSDIIWSKPNPMPESVTDRPTKAHEYIFLLSKSARYYYDHAAIAEIALPHRGEVLDSRDSGTGLARGMDGQADRQGNFKALEFGRNKRSVWHVATQPYPEAHFATYPEKLIEPCILAGSRPGDTVLDPFTGSGTTGAVAVRLQRHFIGCELNAKYILLAQKRISAVAPLFTRAAEDTVNGCSGVNGGQVELPGTELPSNPKENDSSDRG